VILYLETNFIIGTALGRDKSSDVLLQASSANLQIALPSVCVMEAWSVFEDEQKRRNHFRQTLDQQISQLRRDETSLHAKALLRLLQQAYTENADLLNDVESRLRDVLSKISGLHPDILAATLLPLTQTVFQSSLPAGPTKDHTDNLILAIILAHASEHPEDEKVFLSGNIKDFQTPEIEALLSTAGITRYFSRTEDFLGWFKAQPPIG
jgi:hypothetical protein